jgi:hypothetical protein
MKQQLKIHNSENAFSVIKVWSVTDVTGYRWLMVYISWKGSNNCWSVMYIICWCDSFNDCGFFYLSICGRFS